MMQVVISTPDRAEHEFELSGGLLCLDFVNTVGGDRAGKAREHLHAYGDLVSWARQAGAIDPAQARLLLGDAGRRPQDAEAALDDAIALREALYRTFAAIAQRGEPAGADIARLSRALGPALAHRRLDRRDGSWVLGWDDPPGALDAPLWRVASSAADLLMRGADLERVRVCGMHETHECSWVFLDGTRARTRRWCSMKDCGNKAKARRHYRRSKETDAG